MPAPDPRVDARAGARRRRPHPTPARRSPTGAKGRRDGGARSMLDVARRAVVRRFRQALADAGTRLAGLVARGESWTGRGGLLGNTPSGRVLSRSGAFPYRESPP